MKEILIISLFALYTIINFCLSVIDMAGASFYDIAAAKKLKKRAAGRKARNQAFPMISVIIPAFNEEKVIKRCIDSVLRSQYPNFEVIVSDDGSTDKTARIVKTWIKVHSKGKMITLVSDGVNRGRGGALNQALKKANGTLIMALDADCTIQKDTLQNAAEHFKDRQVAALAANVKIMPHLSVLGLLQQFEWVTSFRSKKFNSLVNAEYIIGGAGATYRKSVLTALHGFDETMLTEDIDMSLRIASKGNKAYHLRYASDVIVMTEHVPSYRGLFRQRFRWKLGSLQALFASRHLFFSRNPRYTKTLCWYRLPLVLWSELMLLFEPFIFVYFIYLAVVLRTPVMFIVSWGALTVMLFFAIWGDDQLTTGQKARFSMFMPTMYLLYYILSSIQVLAVIKAAVSHRIIRGKKSIRGAWVSPERIAS